MSNVIFTPSVVGEKSPRKFVLMVVEASTISMDLSPDPPHGEETDEEIPTEFPPVMFVAVQGGVSKGPPFQISKVCARVEAHREIQKTNKRASERLRKVLGREQVFMWAIFCPKCTPRKGFVGYRDNLTPVPPFL